jgi:pSer/pThr/pTyr-binding forkhead associated (FHA) protein
MTGTLVFIVRLLVLVSLYVFLLWALILLWRELRARGQAISLPQIPELSLSPVDTFEGDLEEAKNFTQPEVFIGRSATSEYPLPDETVSSRHARLSYHHNQWWAEDLQSTNGTFLNDEPVSVPTVIVSGDELRCGQVRLMIDIRQRGR